MRIYTKMQAVFRVATMLTFISTSLSLAAEEFVLKVKPSSSLLNLTAELDSQWLERARSPTAQRRHTEQQ